MFRASLIDAAYTISRAPAFESGATASSDARAFSTIFALVAGTVSRERMAFTLFFE